MNPTVKKPFITIVITAWLFALPVLACDEANAMRRLVTFIKGAEEVEGFWSFCWDDEVRRTQLLLRQSDGTTVELEQVISLNPVFSVVSTLGNVNDEPLFQLEVHYPSVLASSFAEALEEMVAGEPVALSLSVRGEDPRTETTTVPEDQTEEYVALVASLTAPHPLADFVPPDLRRLVQVLADVAGPRRQLDGGDADAYALASGLLGALDVRTTASAPSEVTAGTWTMVERPVNRSHHLRPAEERFLREVGKVDDAGGPAGD